MGGSDEWDAGSVAEESADEFKPDNTPTTPTTSTTKPKEWNDSCCEQEHPPPLYYPTTMWTHTTSDGYSASGQGNYRPTGDIFVMCPTNSRKDNPPPERASECPCSPPGNGCKAIFRGPQSASLPVGSAQPTVKVPKGKEQELFDCAANMLLENTDLIEWVICWVYGDEKSPDKNMATFYQCVLKHLSPKDPQISMAPAKGSSIARVTGADVLARNPFITWYRSDTWHYNTKAWGKRAKKHKLCACIDVAGSLFHEVLHTCGDFGFGKHVGLTTTTEVHLPGKCTTVYLAQNLLVWGLFQRYPEAGNSKCCTFVSGSGDSVRVPIDERFWSDASIHNQGGCLLFPNAGKDKES